MTTLQDQIDEIKCAKHHCAYIGGIAYVMKDTLEHLKKTSQDADNEFKYSLCDWDFERIEGFATYFDGAMEVMYAWLDRIAEDIEVIKNAQSET